MIAAVAKEFQPQKQESAVKWREDHDQASAHFSARRLPILLDGILLELEHGRKVGDTWRIQMIARLSLITDFPKEEVAAFFDYLTDPANLIQMKTGATAIAFAVILFSKYHRRSENLDSCPVDRDVWGHFVRLKLLAAIFRLADALHIDRTRFPEAEFESLRLSPEFTETNRMHWIKSYIINTIRIDPSRYTVTIQADLPESPVGEASSPGDRIEDSMLTCAPALAVAQPFSTRTRRS